MTTKTRLKETIPDGYARSPASRATSAIIAPRLPQVVKLRPSIVTSCAYCVPLHGREALSAGEGALAQHRHLYRVVGHEHARWRGILLAASASVRLGGRARAA